MSALSLCCGPLGFWSGVIFECRKNAEPACLQVGPGHATTLRRDLTGFGIAATAQEVGDVQLLFYENSVLQLWFRLQSKIINNSPTTICRIRYVSVFRLETWNLFKEDPCTVYVAPGKIYIIKNITPPVGMIVSGHHTTFLYILVVDPRLVCPVFHWRIVEN